MMSEPSDRNGGSTGNGNTGNGSTGKNGDTGNGDTGNTAEGDFVTVATVDEVGPGEGRAFPLGDQMVALFQIDGTFYAITDACPHMGASLAGGHFEDDVVTCPWHAWRFCVRDGTWCDNPKVKIDAYEVRVVGDDIQVRPKSKS